MDREKVIAVAKSQRRLLAAFLLLILLNAGIYFTTSKELDERLMYAIYLGWLIMCPIVIYRSGSLMKSIGTSTLAIVVFCILLIVPFLNFIMLLVISGRATGILREAGLEPGLFGVSSYDFAAYIAETDRQAQQNISDEQVSAGEPAENVNAPFEAGTGTEPVQQDDDVPSRLPRTARRTRSRPIMNSFFHKAAKASCVLPLAALAIGYATLTWREMMGPEVGFAIGVLNLALISIGFLLALISLFGIPIRGSKGILLPALLALVLNGLFIALFGFTMNYARIARERADKKLEEEGKHWEEMGEASVTDYPGWCGVRAYQGTIIGAASLDPRSPMGKDTAKLFSKRFLILHVAVDNTHGKTDLALDPSSVRLRLKNGKVINAVPVRSVMETASEDKEDYIRRFSGRIDVPAGWIVEDRFACIPWGTDMKLVDMISISINGRAFTISGEYLSVKEKRKRFELNKEIQK